MVRMRAEAAAKDPATGRALPPGVSCRGEMQYRARKLVDGQRVTKTFETARLAREWLEAKAVDVRRGTHVDTRSLDQWTISSLV